MKVQKIELILVKIDRIKDIHVLFMFIMRRMNIECCIREQSMVQITIFSNRHCCCCDCMHRIHMYVSICLVSVRNLYLNQLNNTHVHPFTVDKYVDLI